jgi:hypothetical protein
VQQCCQFGWDRFRAALRRFLRPELGAHRPVGTTANGFEPIGSASTPCQQAAIGRVPMRRHSESIRRFCGAFTFSKYVDGFMKAYKGCSNILLGRGL